MKKWIVALFLLGALIWPQGARAAVDPDEPVNSGPPGRISRETPIVVAVRQCNAAVVNLYVRKNAAYLKNIENNNGKKQAPAGRNQKGEPIFTSSGVIVDARAALIVTNEHSVNHAEEILVKTSHGDEYKAEVVSVYPDDDLAVIKLINPGRLTQIALGDSDALAIGETVIAIGNPGGYANTATVGIISGLNREVNVIDRLDGVVAHKGLIQIDANINPGNSGGALINTGGQLIGINASAAQESRFGFAIPVNKVKPIISTNAPRPIAGLDLGMELEDIENGGCLVTWVLPGGPADKAGVKTGDVLVSLNSVPVGTISEYETALTGFRSSDIIFLNYKRDGQRLSQNIKPLVLSPEDVKALAWDVYGLKVRQTGGRLTAETPKEGTPAQAAGLAFGDYVVALGGRNILTEDEFVAEVFRNRVKSSLSVSVQRGENVYQIKFKRRKSE